MAALNSAAQKGLQPGTEEYYLTPRKNKAKKWEILGVIGYQGLITLMYRSGAVSSVTVEAVHANDDFKWQPGEMEKPKHAPNWFGDRGDVVGAYAYATMKDGSTSKVVVVDQGRIQRAMDASAGSHSEYSPWKKHYEAMVLKTAAHDLAKWVPTSAVDRTVQNAQAVIGEQNAQAHAQRQVQAPAPQTVYEDEFIEAIAEEDSISQPTGELAADSQLNEIRKRYAKNGYENDEQIASDLEVALQSPGITMSTLTRAQADQVLAMLAAS